MIVHDPSCLIFLFVVGKALFSRPSIPTPPLPQPPQPVRSTPMEAQLSQLGQRQGLIAAMFGIKNPSTSSANTGKATLTGQ